MPSTGLAPIRGLATRVLTTSTFILPLIFTAGCFNTLPTSQPASPSSAPSAPATATNEPTEPSDEPDPSEPPEPSETPTQAATTCKTLIPEVLRISKESKNDTKIIQVYRPKTIKDQQAAYAAGKLKIKKNKTRVAVLTCQGVAALDNNETVDLDYALSADLNGDGYVSYEWK